MIIELTGIPAAGKTTLISRIADRCPRGVAVYSNDMILSHYHLNFIINAILRKAASDIVLYMLFAININMYISYVKYYAHMLLYIKERFIIKVNIFRNIVFKFAIFHFVRTKCKNLVVIIDEGISHIPFNFIDYRGEKEIDLVTLFDRLLPVTRHIVVVKLEREPEAVKAHLERRGHRRLQRNTHYTLDQFMHRNRLLSAAFESLPDRIFFRRFSLQLGSPHDGDFFIHLLQNEIMK